MLCILLSNKTALINKSTFIKIIYVLKDFLYISHICNHPKYLYLWYGKLKFTFLFIKGTIFLLLYGNKSLFCFILLFTIQFRWRFIGSTSRTICWFKSPGGWKIWFCWKFNNGCFRGLFPVKLIYSSILWLSLLSCNEGTRNKIPSYVNAKTT